jgi:mannosyltransferase
MRLDARPADAFRFPATWWRTRIGLWWLAPLTVLAVGAGLRFYRLGYQELRGDEGFSYLIARLPTERIVPTLLEQGDPHSPLHYLLLHGWMALAGTSELVLRTPSALLGILLLGLLFGLGQALGGRRLGLLLGGLAALSQGLVWLAQDARNQYVLALVCATAATLLFARALRRPGWSIWCAYGLACALTVYSHYYGLFALLAHGLYFLAEPAARRHVRSWLLSALGGALLFAPWLLAMWPRLMAAGQLTAPDRPALLRHLDVTLTYLAVGSVLGARWGRGVYGVGVVLAALGAVALYRRQRGWAALLMGWCVLTLLGIYALRFTRQTFNAFYAALAAPAWWALVGAGLLYLWERRRPLWRALAALGLVVFVAANLRSLANHYWDPAYDRMVGYRPLVAYLATQAQAGDVFVANFPDPCYDYYLERIPLPRTMQPARMNPDPAQTQQALDILGAQYERLWFVPNLDAVWDPRNTAHRCLDERCLLEQETTFRYLHLYAYRPRHTLAATLRPLDARLGALLRLEGFWVTMQGQPGAWDSTSLLAAPGATLQVTLYWHALRPTPTGYTVFVHLLGADGKLLAQHDGWPVNGLRPTWTWQPDESLLDRHTLALPPQVAGGTGTLLVGLYDSQTIVRQRFADGQETIPLATVRFRNP